ncbi:MAG: glycosyltransferase [Candidatus Jordarchaeaceae archaeon]
MSVTIVEFVRGLDIGGVDGGAERFGAELSIALARRGMEVRVLILNRSFSEVEREWLSKLDLNNVPWGFVFNFPMRGRIQRFYRGVQLLREQLRKMEFGDPIIIHTHSHICTMITLIQKNFFPNLKVVRTAHKTKEWDDSLWGFMMRTIWGYMVFPLLCDSQVAVSRSVLSRLPSRKSSFSKSLIYNAIFLPPSKPSCYKKERCLYMIGTASRLTEQKGLGYLIKTAKLVQKRLPNVKFLIAGDGELKDFLRSQIQRLELEDTVFLIGNQSNILSFFSQLDLFVLPSLWEGLPTVVLESMAAGVPVIATNVPGTDELIEDGVDGWLVPPRDPQALAEKIIFALRSPHLRRQVSEAGRKKAEQFSIDKIADQYIDLFQKLLNE